MCLWRCEVERSIQEIFVRLFWRLWDQSWVFVQPQCKQFLHKLDQTSFISVCSHMKISTVEEVCNYCSEIQENCFSYSGKTPTQHWSGGIIHGIWRRSKNLEQIRNFFSKISIPCSMHIVGNSRPTILLQWTTTQLIISWTNHRMLFSQTHGLTEATVQKTRISWTSSFHGLDVFTSLGMKASNHYVEAIWGRWGVGCSTTSEIIENITNLWELSYSLQA